MLLTFKGRWEVSPNEFLLKSVCSCLFLLIFPGGKSKGWKEVAGKAAEKNWGRGLRRGAGREKVGREKEKKERERSSSVEFFDLTWRDLKFLILWGFSFPSRAFIMSSFFFEIDGGPNLTFASGVFYYDFSKPDLLASWHLNFYLSVRIRFFVCA